MLIFQHRREEVPITWKSGIDIAVENPVCNEKEELDLELNVCESQYYPGGPKCIPTEYRWPQKLPGSKVSSLTSTRRLMNEGFVLVFLMLLCCGK